MEVDSERLISRYLDTNGDDTGLMPHKFMVQGIIV